MIALADPDRPLHVGVLLGNTPDMLRAMAGAALGGYVLCGLNTTRRARRCWPTYAAPTASCCWSTTSTRRCSRGSTSTASAWST